MAKKNEKSELTFSTNNSTSLKRVQVQELVSPENLKENQVFIEDYGVVTIKPTKLRYFEILGKDKNSMYGNVMFIKQYGFQDILLYKDGRQIVETALKAIFDVDEIDFYDNLTTVNLNRIIDIANEVNEVKIEDFLTIQKMAKEESQSKEEA